MTLGVFFETDDQHDVEGARGGLVEAGDAGTRSRGAAGGDLETRLAGGEGSLSHPQLGKGPPFEQLHVGDDDGIDILRANACIFESRRGGFPHQLGLGDVESSLGMLRLTGADHRHGPHRASTTATACPWPAGPQVPWASALRPGRPATARTARRVG